MLYNIVGSAHWSIWIETIAFYKKKCLASEFIILTFCVQKMQVFEKYMLINDNLQWSLECFFISVAAAHFWSEITHYVLYEGQRGAGFMIFLWQTLYSRTTFDPYYILGTSTCSVFSVKTQWDIKSEKSII